MVLIQYERAEELARLGREGEETSATLISQVESRTYRRRTRTVFYRYETPLGNFSGRTSLKTINDGFAAGRSVPITYAPEKPSFSYLASKRAIPGDVRRWRAAIPGISAVFTLILAGLGSFPLFAAWRERRLVVHGIPWIATVEHTSAGPSSGTSVHVRFDDRQCPVLTTVFSLSSDRHYAAGAKLVVLANPADPFEAKIYEEITMFMVAGPIAN